ncbi:MAG: type II toxin-antitoxin system RelE/ParE family toxin [Candidatus Caenarcaniphilales bacterium]|nr:type II toxin-antitoxin system RelE/ParE family toxin [Candidatus Caenarcaniphilales bacterium]
MQILQTNRFKKTVKKLDSNQKKDLDKVVKELIKNPTIGEAKKGDLSGIRVYKFKMNKQLALLAYMFEEEKVILTLLALDSHQNFYRDLKGK